ncbi:hypothetical protein B0J17DRAFT_335495 [Rhizoctonia solani]|nr:hypothetical protein B0J17DRAFT_335495 [Rhizoctonia solani]
MLAQASTAHALPRETSSGGVPGSPPPRSSGEGGRRRSSTLGHVEFAPRPGSPPRPPIPGAEDGMVDGASQRDSAAPIATLEPAAEIVTSSVDPTFDSLKGDKSKKLQRRRSKNAFSHLFALKGDKIFRSPPPAKATEDPVPPVPSIPEALAKAVADPDTPEVSQSSTVASTPTTTPKSSKSKRFKRHRRATIGSISQLPGDLPGTPSSTAQPEAPKTPTTPRTRTFTIVDLRKGFHVRGLGKSKGKLLSAKSNPEIRSPPPSARELSQASESSENPESPQRHRPPPLQSTESPQPAAFSIAVNGETDGSPETADFVASLDATDVLPSPIESTGPVTPVYGAPETPAPAPVSESPEQEAKVSSSSEEVPDLSYTATTDENEPPLRPSEASEATLLSDDPLFTALSAPSNLGDMQLQLREPSTKTSTLDAHLRIGSLRFEDFSFDTNVF